MIKRIKTIVENIWQKIRYPKIRTEGIHYIRIGTEIILIEGGKISIGNKVSTHRRVCFSVIGGQLTIGQKTSFNRNDIIVCRDMITIGKYCSFGPNVCIYDHDHVFNMSGHEKYTFKTSPIIIEDNCWIGANAVILRGTHIGEGCVIGAGAVVKGTIPAHSIVKDGRTLEIEPIKK
ncbi:MAG: acyltransferase [Clostridia bacterium]|nr:acyltransferase [Clostridia bacterium]